MATQLNRGLAAVIARPGKSFTDYAVETERNKAGRKRGAIDEARQLLISKQAFAPYAGAVNTFLNNAIDEISKADDLDPAAYTQAVEQYMEYYNYSKQVDGFLKESAAAYQKDKEVNETVAAKAIMDRYVKDGSLEELASIASQQMDAEDVVLNTPGALKEDVVVKNRLDRFGEIILSYSEQSDKAKSIGGGNMVLEGSQIAKKYKQYIKRDGNDIYVDPAALEDKGFLDVLMSDARMKAIVERRLKSKGVEAPPTDSPVAEKKAYNNMVRDELAEVMNPFADYEEKVSRQDRYMSDWNVRRSSSGSRGSASSKNKMNDWFVDLVNGTPKAASYLKGANIPVAHLPINDPEVRKQFEFVDEIYVTDSKIEGNNIKLKIRAKEGEFDVKETANRWNIFRGSYQQEKTTYAKEIDVLIPIENFKDPETAALLYQDSFIDRKSHYEGTAGVGAGITGENSAPAKPMNGVNLNDL